MYKDKYKKNWDKLFKEVGMAVPKNIQTRVVMIRYKGHPYSSPPLPINLHGVANKTVLYPKTCCL